MTLWKRVKQFLTPNEPKLKSGFVKFFNYKRGYGFISSIQTEKDVFVHVTEVEDKLRAGDRVLFETQDDQKGLKAVNVRLAHAETA